MARNNPDAGINLVKNATSSIVVGGGVSPVTAGDANANSTSIPIHAPFLPKTVLKEGAKGATISALKARLHLLYTEGFLSITPLEPFNRFTSKGDTHAYSTWDCVKAYIDQGISYKDKNPSPTLQQKSSKGIYDVDRWVWESLGLPVMSTWEDMFGQINTSGDTVWMQLFDNTATITWEPRFEIYRYNSSTGKEEKISPRYIYPADQQYYDILKDCLDGVLRWPSAHKNNIGGQVEIQGVLGDVKFKIKDHYGKVYDPNMPIDYYYFHTPKGSKSNITIRLTNKSEKESTAMVPASFFTWSYNGNLSTYIEVPLVIYGNSKYATIGQTIEHEFGHVIGLFDAYGYESKDDTANYSYGDHKHPSFTFPPAYIDGKNIKWYSVMVGKYWNNEYFYDESDPQTPKPPTRPFTRTALDYEMLLFAWRDNELQCYVDRILESKSQAFYH